LWKQVVPPILTLNKILRGPISGMPVKALNRQRSHDIWFEMTPFEIIAFVLALTIYWYVLLA